MIFKLVYGETDESLRLSADASLLEEAIRQVNVLLRSYNNAIQESIRVSAQFTRQGIQVTGSLQQQAEAGRVVTTTIKGLVTSQVSLNETLKVTQRTAIDTIEKEKRLLEQRKKLRRINEEVAKTNKDIALNRKAAARATTTKILGTIATPTFKASTEEARAFGNELGRLAELQQRFNLSQQRVLSIFQNVRRGGVNAYTGVERQVANASANIIRAQERLGTSAKREFGKLTAAVRATKLKQLRSELGRVEKAGVQAAQKMEISFRSFGRLVFVGVVSRAFGSLLRVLRESIDQAREFSIRIAEIRTISRNNQLTFEQWTKGVRELSEAFGLNAIDVAEGTYQILSNQVAEGAKAFEFQKDAALLARAAVSTNAEAVGILTAAINAFGLESSDTNRVIDILFKTVELGRLRLADIAESFGRVAALANQLGVSLVELNAAIAAITIQGVTTEETLTGLRNIFLKLIKPTDAMKEKFKEFGVSSGDALIATFTFEGAIQKFADILEREGTPAIGKLFGRVRAIIPVLLLAGTASKDFAIGIKEIGDSAGAATRAAGEILTSIGARFERELTKIRNFFTVTIGVDLLKNIINITDTMGGLANIIKSLTVVTAAAAGAFVVARLATVGWKLATIAMTVATGQLAVAQASLKALLLTNPYAIVAIAVLAIGAALLTAISNMQSFEDQVKESIPRIRAEFAEFFADQIKASRKANEVITRGVENIFKQQLQIIAGIKSTLNTVLKENEKILEAITKSLRNKFRDVSSTFRSVISEAKRNAQDASRAFDESVRKTSEILFEQFKTGFDISIEGLASPEVVERLKEEINKLTDTLVGERITLDLFGLQDFDRREFDRTANLIKQRIEQLREIRTRSGKESERLAERENRLIQRRDDIQRRFQRRLEDISAQARKARGNREKERQIEIQINRIRVDAVREFGKINKQITDIRDKSSEIARIDISRQQVLKRLADLRKQQLDFDIQIGLEAKKTEVIEKERQTKLEEGLKIFRERFREFIALKPEKIFEEGFKGASEQVNVLTDQILKSLKLLDPEARAQFILQIETRRAKLLENLEIRERQKRLTAEATARLKEQEIVLKQFKLITAERVKFTKEIIEAEEKALGQFDIIQKQINRISLSGIVLRRKEFKELLAANREEIEKALKFLETEADRLRKIAPSKLEQALSLGPISLDPQRLEATEQIIKSLSDFLFNTRAQRDAILTIDTTLKTIGEKLNIIETPAKTFADNMKIAATASEKLLAAFKKIVKITDKLPAVVPKIPGQQFGGLIPGRGTRDSVPALLTPGEFVVNAAATRKFFSQLVAINSGVRPRGFQEGGMVNNIGDINVSVTTPSGVDGRELARVLKQELFRRSVRLS